MKRIVFVCTANICRSPMAAGIFNALAEDQGLEATAESAGVSALVGEPAAPYARQVTDELGIDIEDHRARQADAQILETADLVLTMTAAHRDILHREFGHQVEKVSTVARYATDGGEADIADPYGLNAGAYRASAREILGYVENLVGRLKEEEKAGTG